jgi:hypothetical protein
MIPVTLLTPELEKEEDPFFFFFFFFLFDEEIALDSY